MNKNFSDCETFKAFQDGDEHAYKIIFDELFKSLVLFSFKITKDLMPAEDIVIEAFLKMAGRAKDKKDCTYKEFRQELYTAVRNASFNYYNRELNRVMSVDEDRLTELSEDSVTASILERDIARTISEEFEHFNPKEKALAEYLFLTPLTTTQIAELLGMNEKTVRNTKALLEKRFIEAVRNKGLVLFILLKLLYEMRTYANAF
jgi:RNA polymerase sigma factor (sigma-70 family)